MRVLVKTLKENYHDDSVEVINNLIERGYSVVLITFDLATRDLVEDLKYKKKADISKLYIIDAISLISGTGSPPVTQLINVYQPDNFTDIEVYSALYLSKLGTKKTCIVFNSLNKLEDFQNTDEIGVFLETFTKFVKKMEVPVILLAHIYTSYILLQIMERNVHEVSTFYRLTKDWKKK